MGPSHAETDVGKADGTPDEEDGETGKGEQPVEDVAALAGHVEVAEETAGDLEGNAPEGTALLVNVLEELGGHAATGESLDGTGGTESAGVCD